MKRKLYEQNPLYLNKRNIIPKENISYITDEAPIFIFILPTHNILLCGGYYGSTMWSGGFEVGNYVREWVSEKYNGTTSSHYDPNR